MPRLRNRPAVLSSSPSISPIRSNSPTETTVPIELVQPIRPLSAIEGSFIVEKNLNNPFIGYLLGSGLLICSKCEIGLIFSRLQDHLRGEKHGISNSEIKRVKEWAIGFPSLIKSEEELEGFSGYPSKETPAIEGLVVVKDGYACNFEPSCKYTAVTEGTIRKHIQIEHQPFKGLRKPPRGQSFIQFYRAKANLQRFFSSGNGSSYFEVNYRRISPIITTSTPIVGA